MIKVKSWGELNDLPGNDKFSVKVPEEYGATAWIYQHDKEWPVQYIHSHAFDNEAYCEIHSQMLQNHGFDVELVPIP